MLHIGIICPTSSGCLNPMTTLGRELQRRGHRVSVISVPDGRAKALTAGLGHIPIGVKEFPVGSIPHLLAELGRRSDLEGVRFSIELFCQAAETFWRDAPQAIMESGVEALLLDQTSFGAETLAEKLRLPYISVCLAPPLHTEPDIPPPFTTWPYSPTMIGRARNRLGEALQSQVVQPLARRINAQRRAWNLAPLRQIIDLTHWPPLAEITQLPASLDFPRTQLPPWFHYTGPFYDDRSGDPIEFPFERLTGKPLIYASLGTVLNRPDVFRMMAAACETLEAQLVISLGSKDQAVLPDYPGSPLVVRYAPQVELIKRAALVITHAGLNTTLEALSHGVPLVAIPITNDQPGVAARVVYTGVGECLPLSRLTTTRLRDTVQRVLTQPRYRDRARQLQAEIKQAQGVTRAVDIIEQAFTTREPVLALNRT
jgi:zeaxanthin glucosyltransferase